MACSIPVEYTDGNHLIYDMSFSPSNLGICSHHYNFAYQCKEITYTLQLPFTVGVCISAPEHNVHNAPELLRSTHSLWCILKKSQHQSYLLLYPKGRILTWCQMTPLNGQSARECCKFTIADKHCTVVVAAQLLSIKETCQCKLIITINLLVMVKGIYKSMHSQWHS